MKKVALWDNHNGPWGVMNLLSNKHNTTLGKGREMNKQNIFSD